MIVSHVWLRYVFLVLLLCGFTVHSNLAYPQTKKQEQATRPASRPATQPGQRGQRTQRRRRRRNRVKRIVLPAPQAMKTQALIDDLNRRNWRRQAMLLDELVRREKSSRALLYQAFLQHKHLRVRLLTAHALARLQDQRPIPRLLALAQAWWDQPTPLLTGAFLAYGKLAVPAILGAVKTAKKPHILLKVLAIQRVKSALPWLRRAFLGSDPTLREQAVEGLRKFPDAIIVAEVEKILKAQPDADLRSTLYRLVSFCQAVKAIPLLIRGLQDRSDAIRFLTRLSLRDKAEGLLQKLAKQVSALPKGASQRDPGAWSRWWVHNQAAITLWYQQREQGQLHDIPRQQIQRVLLMYRTIHPMFGYGRMPLLVHDARWKQPTSPIPGKLWRVGLPSKVFAGILRQVRRGGFMQWPQDMGHVRDLTVYDGKRSHRVSIGMIRHFPFEQLERVFLQLSKRVKLHLNFYDFYRRKDEQDLVSEGQVGQWAYRSMDKMQLQPWTPRDSWKPLADLEGLFGTLADISRYMPSRTRLMYLDLLKRRVRFSSLLYGSRSQSRYTRDGLSKSRRLSNFELQGIGVIYLVTDKIEQMIFDFQRRLLPLRSRYAAPARKKLALLSTLTKILNASNVKLMSLRIEWGQPHRLFARFKAKDSYAIRQVVGRLALYSSGDRVIGLRINQSGAPDRDRYSVIAQLQWEMLDTVQPPPTTPHSLQPGKPPVHNMFAPIVR